jgi:hypothetical protein
MIKHSTQRRLILFRYGVRTPAQTALEPPGVAVFDARGTGRGVNPGQAVEHALGSNTPIGRIKVIAKDGLVRRKDLQHRRAYKICAQIFNDAPHREWIVQKARQSSTEREPSHSFS